MITSASRAAGLPARLLASVRSVPLLAAVATLALLSGGSLAAEAAPAAALPAGTYCQGPQASQPASGPKKVLLIDLENASSSAVASSSSAPFQNGTLSKQCGSFAATAMHNTTHGSESNYFAQMAGVNAATDAVARFGLSDCPPDSTSTTCKYGSGHFASSVPSIFSEIQQAYGNGGWKTYADDMPSNCLKYDATAYATANGKSYKKYAVNHNPAAFFAGAACSTQDVPSGNWRGGQGALSSDLTSGNLPRFSYIQPNEIENGHDPSTVGGVTVAGGTDRIANIDDYLSSVLPLIASGPDYQSGQLVVMVVYDEGFTIGASGDGAVGQNCADPAISAAYTSCQAQAWIVGRYVPAHRYSTYANHFALLAATQRILGVTPLLGHAADSSTPDLIAGTTGDPDPFNLAPGGAGTPPPTATVPASPTGLKATPSTATVSLAWTAPTDDGGSPITDYAVEYRLSGASTWQRVSRTASTSTTATVSSLTAGATYDFRVSAVNAVGTGSPSSTVSATTSASPPTSGRELLADPGFESGTGGWTKFGTGTLSRVTAPVRTGTRALSITSTSASRGTPGMTQNSVVANSTAGTTYTASCFVRPASGNQSVLFRFLEYTQNYSTVTKLQSTTAAALPAGVWTRVSVSSVAQRSGERIIPQIYSTSQTASTGAVVYDDCSVTAG